ncbi:MAG: hypothetical protein IPM50_15310 [Acidobacteriota bacterium]|nr:MAG: hypothetical protein IPM50_15310 [Acidobacteriota bacterium]
MAVQLNIEQLRNFAPQSQILAFSPQNTGSPMQDWCAHLGQNPTRRRELEEFAVLGDVVVRIADELEPEPLDRVKIMSLEYAMKTLGDEEDAREFVRCVKAIASPDAGQFEFAQIAAYYYGEIRRRGAAEVLKEMGLLGMEMTAVTSTIADREISVEESRTVEQKLTVADQRRVQEAAKNRKLLPAGTPNFDEELKYVIQRVGRQKVSRMIYDEFAAFYLEDGDKSIEDLDRDFLTFDNLEQYNENGIVGLTMNSGQRSVVVFDLECEIDATCLPLEARSIASELGRLFVGHSLGGRAVRDARDLIAAAEAERNEWAALQTGQVQMAPPAVRSDEHSTCPFSDWEFEEWLGVKLDELYGRRVTRSVRRIRSYGQGRTFEYMVGQEVNPDHEEMHYVASVCRTIWNRQYEDFHLRSLRHQAYQDLYVALRDTVDSADVADLKKQAYAALKEHQELSLKEFTALNTVAKSQESRLRDRISPLTRKWLRMIENASAGRLRFLKFSLYNDSEAKAMKRQEKQRLWDAVRSREAELKTEANAQVERVQQNTVQQTRVVRVVHAA